MQEHVVGLWFTPTYNLQNIGLSMAGFRGTICLSLALVFEIRNYSWAKSGG